MKAAGSHGFLRLCVLMCFFLLLPAFTCAADKMAFSTSHLGVLATEQSRRKSHPKQRHPNSNAFYKKQTEDQSLQFMWSLYKKAANSDGRPKQRKLFGSNTVRLIRASGTGKHFYSSANGKTFYSLTHFDCICDDAVTGSAGYIISLNQSIVIAYVLRLCSEFTNHLCVSLLRKFSPVKSFL